MSGIWAHNYTKLTVYASLSFSPEYQYYFFEDS